MNSSYYKLFAGAKGKKASGKKGSGKKGSGKKTSGKKSGPKKAKKSKCGSGNYFKNGNMKKVGSKLLVFRGCRHHTASGQTKNQLMKNKRGKVVSKAQHAAGVKNFNKFLKKSGKRMVFKKGHKGSAVRA